MRSPKLQNLSDPAPLSPEQRTGLSELSSARFIELAMEAKRLRLEEAHIKAARKLPRPQ